MTKQEREALLRGGVEVKVPHRPPMTERAREAMALWADGMRAAPICERCKQVGHTKEDLLACEATTAAMRPMTPDEMSEKHGVGAQNVSPADSNGEKE